MNESTPLLDTINNPEDLRALPVESLPQLCREIRQHIVTNLSSNPGHFASSMGAVEITVALHYVFNTPYDRIVWDVGHQAYAHKILTGRKNQFDTLRHLNGLSGFPTPRESEYDTFVAGHASNSISAALGYAVADELSDSDQHRKTVALIGDASISGGLAFEGLNNASNSRNNLLIILNDNDMSIDDNVGALHRYLMQLTTSKGYNRLRHNTYEKFKKIGLLTDRGRGLMLRFNNSVKALVAGNQNIFEGLNIRYFGPTDGHDVISLVRMLMEIKEMQGPRLLHIKTRKGKGFMPAEEDPTTWHAPGKFDPDTGTRSSRGGGDPLWQEVFGKYLVRLADADSRVVGITAAMPSGTSMSELMAAFPARAFDVGISEGHAVTFAGGLAAGGKRPFVAIYSSFLQRAYDNIIHDVCIQGLPVTFCIDRAGIVGEDGVTHHGMFDLAYLRVIPNLKVAAPTDDRDLKNLMYTSLKQSGPMAIRYPRGKAIMAEGKYIARELQPGKGRILTEAPDASIGIITIGPVATDAAKAIAEIKTATGKKIAHYDALWLKPLDEQMVRDALKRHKIVITVEDGSRNGGLGSAVAEIAAGLEKSAEVIRAGVPDNWVHHGTVAELKAICGYDSEGLRTLMENQLSRLESDTVVI